MNIKKSKVAKTLIVLFLIIAVVSPFLFYIFKNVNDYDFTINKYEMDVVVDDYGDMHVVERVTNKYSNRNTVFYKNLIYSKNNSFSSPNDKSVLIEDVRVKVEDSSGVVFDTDTDTNTYGHFVGYSYYNDKDERGDFIRCEEDAKDCAMIFYYDNTGIADVTTFTYEYTIKGVISEYGDISEFNWVLLGYQPMVVKNIKINVTFPDGEYDIAQMDTFFHGISSGKREFVDNNKILITADKMAVNEKIETRLLVDKEVFSSVRSENKVTSNKLEELLNFEKDQIETASRDYVIRLSASVIFFVLSIGLLIVFTIVCYKKYDKEFSSSFYNEYYRELPAEYAPVIMGFLYKFKEIDDNDLTATLLDLIRRKYLILENPSASVNEDKPDYTILLNKEKNQDDLTKQEKHLIKWFINDIGDGEKVKSRDLSDYCKKSSNAVKYQDNNNKWVRLVKEESEKYDFFDKSIGKAKSKYAGLGFVIVLLGVSLLGIYKTYLFDLAMIFGLIVLPLCCAYFVYITTFNRRSKAGNEDFVRWRAFNKFLEEFSTFEDYPVPSLIIWEHYLVYATSFGIADKVMKQLKLKFSVSQFSESNSTFIGYYGYNYNCIHLLNASLRESKVQAITTIARNNSRSFGGGSGGFSGGSSFGGGGGSFGGR